MIRGAGVSTYDILQGDCLEVLAGLPASSVHCVVTSPPYFGLRDYGIAGQIGLEKTIGDYVDRLVAVFDQVRRVLRPDGTLWLNLGDSYNGSGGAGGDYAAGGLKDGQAKYQGRRLNGKTARILRQLRISAFGRPAHVMPAILFLPSSWIPSTVPALL